MHKKVMTLQAEKDDFSGGEMVQKKYQTQTYGQMC